MKQETQDNFNLCYVHSYQEKEHHWFASNGFAGIQSLYRPVLKHIVLFRTLLGKYKRSHFGAFSPCPKQSAFHSYQVAWFVTNSTRPQQQTIFLPQNSQEIFRQIVQKLFVPKEGNLLIINAILRKGVLVTNHSLSNIDEEIKIGGGRVEEVLAWQGVEKVRKNEENIFTTRNLGFS